MNFMDLVNLVIAISYFFIPLQILISLWKYPRLARMPTSTVVLLVLFALFIFLCGAGHLMRYLGHGDPRAFAVENTLTAVVSLLTALYLMPLIPHLLGNLDQSLRDLVKLNRETEESKLKLVMFMAFLCHEIRNPLFAITSSASFLQDTDMTEEQEVGVGSILDSSLLMLRLVNDVLDLSKIDAGKLDLEERDFDLHRLLYNLENSVRMQISHRHESVVELGFHVAPDVPRVVRGDSTRMMQIVYNLLSNSSKFTSSGRIDLTVSVLDGGLRTSNDTPVVTSVATAQAATVLKDVDEASDEEELCMTALLEEGMSRESGERDVNVSLTNLPPPGEMVVLSIEVADTGEGIALERIKTIFEPYSQAKTSDYRKYGGTGLGLSIVSSLIKMMGGTVDVTSVVGVGSRFVLRFFIRVAPEESPGGDPGMMMDDDHDGTDDVAEDVDVTDPLLSRRRLPLHAKRRQELHGQRQAGDSGDSSLAKQANDLGVLHDAVNDNVKLLSPRGGEPQNRHTLPSTTAIITKKKSSINPVPSSNSKKVAHGNKPNMLPAFDFPPNDCVVLVVDDDSVNRRILGRMLSFFNVEHREATNSAEALRALKSSRNSTGDPTAPRYGLVLMDLSMPVMDGYDAIEAWRKYYSRLLEENGRQEEELPIVALTATALDQERERALNVGANEFQTKPIMRSDLHAICSRLLLPPRSSSEQQQRPATAAAAVAIARKSIVDWSRVNVAQSAPAGEGYGSIVHGEEDMEVTPMICKISKCA